MIQDIELYTADGRLVETVQDPVVGMMGATGKPPEVVVWGERVFVLAPSDGYRPGTIRYREGMAWTLRLGREATAMPSLAVTAEDHSIRNPRPQIAESDISGTQKMTGSYKLRGYPGFRVSDVQPPHLQSTERPPDFRELANAIAAERQAARNGEDFFPSTSPHDEIAQARRAARAEDALLAAVRELYAMDQTPGAVNEILEEAPDSWDGEESGDWIAVQFVKEMCRRLDAAGISREKHVGG